MIEIHYTKSELETKLLGKDFSKKLKDGDVVALFGGLGSGKTQFIKGVCEGLGISVEVTSPSFTIMNIYQGSTNVFHYDFYRIDSEEEVANLGVKDYLFSDGICLIEWAEKLKPFLPDNRYDVHLDLGDSEETRIIKINKISNENIRY